VKCTKASAASGVLVALIFHDTEKVQGSRLKAQGSRLKAQGSRLKELIGRLSCQGIWVMLVSQSISLGHAYPKMA
jgi:hypothetical protein